MSKSGEVVAKRNKQLTDWIWEYMQAELMDMVLSDPQVASSAHQLEKEVILGRKTPGLAAELLLRAFLKSQKEKDL